MIIINTHTRGVIGETAKKGRRRQSVSELSGFELIGGGMNESNQ